MEWSPDLLKALIDERDVRYQQRFDAAQQALTTALTAQERAVQAAMAAQEKYAAAALAAAQLAIDKAESNTKDWKASSNEWRGAMTDREHTFISRNEHDLAISGLEKQIDELKQDRDRQAGRSGGLTAGWGYLVAAIGLAATVVMVVITLSR